MRKSTLFMACCIGLMLLASCKKDPVAPTINVFNGSGYVTENAQIFSGEVITVGFNAFLCAILNILSPLHFTTRFKRLSDGSCQYGLLQHRCCKGDRCQEEIHCGIIPHRISHHARNRSEDERAKHKYCLDLSDAVCIILFLSRPRCQFGETYGQHGKTNADQSHRSICHDPVSRDA